jgi:hypothetical protein
MVAELLPSFPPRRNSTRCGRLADTRPVRAQLPQPDAPPFRIDPGWLFLIAGGVILAAVVLLPAMDGLRDAEHHRDRAIALETHQLERLARYSDFLSALDAGDPTLMRDLAASQLNLAPVGQDVVLAPATMEERSADVFARLEPGFTPPVEPTEPDSVLHALATGGTTRLWMIAGGAFCVLLGVLPPARSRAE